MVYLASLILALILDRLVDSNFRRLKDIKLLILVLCFLYGLCFIMLTPSNFIFGNLVRLFNIIKKIKFLKKTFIIPLSLKNYI